MPIFRRQRKIGKVRIVPNKESCEMSWLFLYVEMENKLIDADMAQLVEQLICNQSVQSSSLYISFMRWKAR